MTKRTIISIGLGSMGSALISGFDRSQNHLMAYTPSGLKADKISFVDQELKSLGELKSSVKKGDILILAMKPQQLVSFYQELKKNHHDLSFLDEVTILSLLAGVQLSGLRELFSKSPLVRVMPNTPCLIHQGLHLVAKDERADKKTIETLLAPSGDVFWVNETQLDFLMPITSSGPGIIFKIFDMWLKNAAQDFDPILLRQMIIKTFFGSAALAMKEDNKNFEELCKQVTSYKGVTERAINTLTHANLEGLFDQAMKEARVRNEELNGIFKSSLNDFLNQKKEK